MPIFGGPRAALIDHRAGMSMSAARVARAPITTMRRCADVMPMVGNRLNVGVCIRIEMLARLPLVSGALNDVKQMRNDAGRAKPLAMLVEVDAPRIAGAFGENLENVPCRVISPDACVDR